VKDRPVKFRSWCIEGKEIIYHDLYWFEEQGITDYRGKGRYNNYEIMQFTGFKDKYGIDIYHGYYNFSHFEKPAINYVYWGQTGDSDGYSHGGHSEWVVGEDSLHDVSGEWCTIVGNIFENLELMEV
jgi:hypothetical protein